MLVNRSHEREVITSSSISSTGVLSLDDTESLVQIIDSTPLAEKFFRSIWNKTLMAQQEEVYVIFVNCYNEVIDYALLNRGGQSKCQVCLPTLFKRAFKFDASGIFIAHNHPKGSLKASKADLEMTYKIACLCKELDFVFLDHLILTKSGYYSFCEGGIL